MHDYAAIYSFDCEYDKMNGDQRKYFKTILYEDITHFLDNIRDKPINAENVNLQLRNSIRVENVNRININDQIISNIVDIMNDLSDPLLIDKIIEEIVKKNPPRSNCS